MESLCICYSEPLLFPLLNGILTDKLCHRLYTVKTCWGFSNSNWCVWGEKPYFSPIMSMHYDILFNYMTTYCIFHRNPASFSTQNGWCLLISSYSICCFLLFCSMCGHMPYLLHTIQTLLWIQIYLFLNGLFYVIT